MRLFAPVLIKDAPVYAKKVDGEYTFTLEETDLYVGNVKESGSKMIEFEVDSKVIEDWFRDRDEN